MATKLCPICKEAHIPDDPYIWYCDTCQETINEDFANLVDYHDVSLWERLQVRDRDRRNKQK